MQILPFHSIAIMSGIIFAQLSDCTCDNHVYVQLTTKCTKSCNEKYIHILSVDYTVTVCRPFSCSIGTIVIILKAFIDLFPKQRFVLIFFYMY